MSNDNQIKKTITDYLRETNLHYAVMIDGKWGTGKTYFVEKVLMPHIENEFKEKNIIYQSLYGLESISDISKQIFLSMLFINKKNSWWRNNKVVESAKKIGVLALPAANLLLNYFGKGEVLKTDISQIFSTFSNSRECILIFDDLERATIPIIQILGFLNNLVEQNHNKMIIIANQEEVNHYTFQQNLELKYLLCSDVFKISFPKEIYEKDKIEQTNLNKEVLLARSKYLFSDDEQYKIIKEKLIGLTITYDPDMETILPLIGKDFIKLNRLSKIFNDRLQTINKYIKECNHSNLRTIQFALYTYNKIGTYFTDRYQTPEPVVDNILEEIIFDIFRTTISMKEGKEEKKWDKNTEYGYQSYGLSWLDFSGIHIGFKFIEKFIYSNEFVESNVNAVLKDYYCKRLDEWEQEQNPLYVLRAYWELSDKDFLDNLNKVIENFRSGSYHPASYQRIIGLVLIADSIGFNIQDIGLEEIVGEMIKRIQKGAGDLDTYDEPIIPKSNKNYSMYQNYVNRLNEALNEFHKTKPILDINPLFINSSAGWSEKFKNYCMENLNEFYFNKAFFSKINVGICFQTVKSSTLKDFVLFRKVVYRIYDHKHMTEYFQNDRTNLKSFLELISKHHYDEKILEYNKTLLVSNLTDVLKKLEIEHSNRVTQSGS